MTHCDVEVEAFEFRKAGDGEIEVCLCEWGGKTRGVYLLAYSAPCFFENVAPRFNKAAVTEVARWPAGADDRMVGCEWVAARFGARAVPVAATGGGGGGQS